MTQRTIKSYGDAGVIVLAETPAAEKNRLSAIIKDDNQEHS